MSKASGPDCIPLVVLKNSEPKLSYTSVKKSCFLDFWKVSLVVTVLKNVAEKFTAKNYFPVSLLSVIINLPYKHAWNTVVMSGLVGLLVLHLLPLLNP